MAATVTNVHIVPGKTFKNGNNVGFVLIGLQDKNNTYKYALVSNTTYIVATPTNFSHIFGFNEILPVLNSMGLSNTN